MPYRLLRRASLGALLLLAGCELTLAEFQVPAEVRPGSQFSIYVAADAQGDGGGACVLQLPLGFEVVGAIANAGSVARDDPAVLGLYQAEPGHFLASFSGDALKPFFPQVTLQVFLRAPAAPGAATLKVTLAGRNIGQPFVAKDPVGIYDFAQITATQHPDHVRSLAVTVDPDLAFVDDSLGLPAPGVAVGGIGAVAFADWNRDGLDDLVTHPYGSGRTWSRTPSGWQAGQTLGVLGLSPSRIASGDFDGDGHLDLAFGSGMVWFGDSAGGWTAGPSLALATATVGVAAGDVDGDGRDDLAFAGEHMQYLAVRLGNADRTFTAASNGLPLQAGSTVVEPVLCDVTGDGLVDLVASDVYAGDGHGNWTVGGGMSVASQACAAVDLDGDGSVEVVHVAPTANGVRVYRHLGGNQWTIVPTNGLPAMADSMAAADVDGDGRVDLAMVESGVGGIGLWRNQGAMSFALVVDSGLPSAPQPDFGDLMFGDLNGDRRPDLVAASPSVGAIVWQNWLGGAASFGSGCQGALPQPLGITANGAPVRGNGAFAVEAHGGVPGTFGLVWLGLSTREWAGQEVLPLSLTPLGAVGCTLYTGKDAVGFGLFDAQGQLSFTQPIPNHPALLRFTFFAQAAAAASASNPLGLAFSGGLSVRVE